MIITIQGKRGEGKSTLANEICRDKWSIHINETHLKDPFCFSHTSESTEFIVIDGVCDYDKVFNLFNKDELEINTPFEKSYSINMPNIIIIKSS